MSKVRQTPKRQHFVDDYFISQNATDAAIKAGYSRKTARSQGQRLLAKVDIQAALAEMGAAIATRN